jgi:hypothetical protein
LEAFMSPNTEPTGPVVALMLPVLNKPLLTYCRAVHNALLDNPAFPNPNPPLHVFAVDIDAFEDAETKAATRAKGAASFRDAKKKRVKEVLFHLRDYVQSVVETSSSADATALSEPSLTAVSPPSAVALGVAAHIVEHIDERERQGSGDAVVRVTRLRSALGHLGEQPRQLSRRANRRLKRHVLGRRWSRLARDVEGGNVHRHSNLLIEQWLCRGPPARGFLRPPGPLGDL